MKFRKDINGLRAIAVIVVVLFHFNSSWMPGGFAGVDVFFVISGFLMTAIIFKGIEQEKFSILKFYVARANRIIPALAFLCFALLVFGWFYLPPSDYKMLGKHAGSSVSFLSNIVYWTEAGYFDAASHEKWLLHTWSLSVEWQFYIIYPLVLVVMRKFMSLKAMRAAVIIGGVIGLLFCVVATYNWPNPSYYLLPTRAWQMMFGGVAYLYPLNLTENKKKIFEWLGLLLIVLSCALISKENPWPGYLAMFPVCGTYLILQAQRNDSIFTGNSLFQRLGKWSYSIYLWHWPFVVGINYFDLSKQYIYIGIALSVILGFLSYTFIERIKFRNDFNSPFQYSKCKPIYYVILASFFGFVTYNKNGFFIRYDQIENLERLADNRTSAEIYYRKNLMQAFSNNGKSYENTYVCTLDGGRQTVSSASNCLEQKLGEGGYLVIGDSHGRDFLHSLLIAYPTTNFAMLHEGSCVPTEYISKRLGGRHCFELLNEIREEFILGNKQIKGVIFASLYGDFAGEDDVGVASILSDINKRIYGDIPIYIVNAGPRLNKNIVDLAIKNQDVKNNYTLNGYNDETLKINDALEALGTKVIAFDKYSVFCNGNKVCNLNDDYEPYVWDHGHLSWLGIKRVSDSIVESNLIRLDN